MATQRLTSNSRNNISRQLLKRAFDKRRTEIAQKMDKNSCNILNSLMTDTEQQILNSIPDGIAYLDDTIWIHQPRNQNLHLRFIQPVRIPFRFINRSEEVYINPELLRERNQIKKEEAELDEEYGEVSRNIRQVLNSVKTVNQLLKVWPDVRSIVENLNLIEPDKKLPVLPIEQLNKQLDLPPK